MINRTILLAALTAMIFAFATLLHPPGRAYACSCLVPPPPGEARDQSAAVFTGTVTAAGPQAAGDQLEVTFNVSESWKGPVAPSLTLFTPTNSAACGYEFVAGKEYLVYANEQDGNLTANLCSRTALLTDASADIQALGQGQAMPQAAPTATPELPATALLLTLAGIAIVGAAAFVIIRNIRRRRTA